jgi:hypothetical protein
LELRLPPLGAVMPTADKFASTFILFIASMRILGISDVAGIDYGLCGMILKCRYNLHLEFVTSHLFFLK